jgi:hypothetical protein
MPRVTIVIPTHDRTDYLVASVESVLAQTLEHFEVVVVGDGSGDDVADALAAFDDPRLRYVARPKAGVSAARNAGLLLARTEYVAFLDDDDLYEPEFLDRLVSFLERTPEVGLAYTSRVEIDREGRGVRFHEPPAAISLEDLVLGFPVTVSDCVMRRALVDEVGGFDPSFAVNEDRALFVRLAFEGCRFARVEGVLSKRRRHEGRSFAGLEEKLADMRRSLAVAFDDPRCPPSVRRLEATALRGILLEWTYQAALAGADRLAREYLGEALRLERPPSDADLCRAFASATTRNGGDPEGDLRRVCAAVLSGHGGWEAIRDAALAEALLRRGACELIWERAAAGLACVARARDLGVRPRERFVDFLRGQLRCCAAAFGPEAARAAAERVAAAVEPLGIAAWFEPATGGFGR